jgi:predicted kinase
VRHNPRWRIVSTDAIRAQLFGDEAIQGPWLSIEHELDRQLRDAQGAMTQQQLDGVICDATHCRRRNRRRMLAQLKVLGFETIDGLWFDVPLDLCLQRNRARSRQVPPEVITAMQRQISSTPPTSAEGFRALYRYGKP